MALLLAVHPAAPGGDRLVGYTLLSNIKAVDQQAIKTLLEQLRAAGIQPDEVITDDRGTRMFVCSDSDYCERRRESAPQPASAEASHA